MRAQAGMAFRKLRSVVRRVRPWWQHGIAARRANPARVTGGRRDRRCLHDIRLLMEGRPGGTGVLHEIDGDQPFSRLLDAFIAIERDAMPQDMIAVRGVYPNHPCQGTGHREGRGQEPWFGEAWRLLICLRDNRPDLALLPIDTAPAGLLLVGDLDPGSAFLPLMRDRVMAQQRQWPTVPDAILNRDDAVFTGRRPLARFVAQPARTPPRSPTRSMVMTAPARRSCPVPPGPAIPAGLFVTHIDNARIRRHFDRLVRETVGLVDWRFAFNPDNRDTPDIGLDYPSSAQCMPRRHAGYRRNGGVQRGFLDVAIFPAAKALDREYTWVLEYDVDYSGDWSTFFTRFADGDADLITTSLADKGQTPWWHWWKTARVPADLDGTAMLRGFHPVLRLSRRMIEGYIETIERDGWGGHYEFTIPTIAAMQGFGILDAGGRGAAVRSYVNNPYRPWLSPGTMVWRPARDHYFHERPGDFPLADMLYHPIKPDVRSWEVARAR